ncbi:MAG: hypothetical protein JWM14_284 [Chitinophagaceae bacterium]|nr:hypothetical protein [Chitinophagaceae bacterium]
MNFSNYINGMKKITLVCFLLLLTHVLHAQISYPKVRKFNVGLFLGIGGESGPVLNIIPVLNLSYRGTTLTTGISLNNGLNIGLIQEILPISVSHYNVKWIASGFYSKGVSDRYYTQDTDYNSYALLTGLRFHFGKRWFSNIQVGASCTNYNTKPKLNIPKDDDKYTEWLPYFEFGLGFRLFKTFEEKHKKVTTQTAE